MSEENIIDEIKSALNQTRHPSINASLLELGIVKDLKLKENTIELSFKLPFARIPENIKQLMIEEIKRVLKPYGKKANLFPSVMTEEEKQNFLAVEKANWKGVPPGTKFD